jgi:hypothetical protein
MKQISKDDDKSKVRNHLLRLLKKQQNDNDDKPLSLFTPYGGNIRAQ